ncbi:hypothetical protein [Desulfatitalea alkaliphila]|uniref:Uncharacterized protein n=1 Tax=Desulfatitalea alkaliphila TaxID=2929485 RepID=A0AA41UIZ0_9BACT|nr:hypothetical protein [Desulfatitalea alkaliphila]MCJ8500609.1 hypothetical protein [Desulfatitalea alkaliphila]
MFYLFAFHCYHLLQKENRYRPFGAGNGLFVAPGILLTPLPPLWPGAANDTEYENNKVDKDDSGNMAFHFGNPKRVIGCLATGVPQCQEFSSQKQVQVKILPDTLSARITNVHPNEFPSYYFQASIVDMPQAIHPARRRICWGAVFMIGIHLALSNKRMPNPSAVNHRGCRTWNNFFLPHHCRDTC